jgi:hypothetical protein
LGRLWSKPSDRFLEIIAVPAYSRILPVGVLDRQANERPIALPQDRPAEGIACFRQVRGVVGEPSSTRLRKTIALLNNRC